MKNTSILLAAFFCMFAGIVQAQQEHQYTQFMYNKLGYNPAYAGSKDAASLTAIYRKQWLGLEGAPETQALSFNMPLLNKRVGIGLNLNRNTIGISEQWTLDGAYSYRLRLGRGHLSLGLQASVRYIGKNYLDSRLVSTIDLQEDNAIDMESKSKYVPNFGVGVYYNTSKFYVGLSAPRILQNNIDFNDVGVMIGREARHLFFMTGLIVKLSDKVDMYPQILLKYAPQSPFDADLNLSFTFVDRFTVGASYRAGGSTKMGLGESFDFLAGCQITRNILLGLSYDFTLSELRNHNDGSIEVALRYSFGQENSDNEYVNPRFF